MPRQLNQNKELTTYIKTITCKPGVYLMLERSGQVIYIGKAKNLNKRVNSYFTGTKDNKTTELIKHIYKIEITTTETELEALLLENALIKEHKPKYNVIFKDDKSYPYLLITTKEEYPQLLISRSIDKNKVGNELFGPYSSKKLIRNSIETLEKIFKLRNCNNSFFNHRKRPCLQYQINRCSAPCVKFISSQDYAQEVQNAIFFLKGKTDDLFVSLVKQMDNYSKNLAYEKAAEIRNKISELKVLQKQQKIIDLNSNLNYDILSIYVIDNLSCIHMLCLRGGQILGSKQFNPKIMLPQKDHKKFLLGEFINQYYLDKNNINILPDKIIVEYTIPCQKIIEQAINIPITKKTSGKMYELIKMAYSSAKESMLIKLNKKSKYNDQFQLLESIFGLKIDRIECFDISHTFGESTVGGCVAFDVNGEAHQYYRKYNIKSVQNDDCRSIEESLARHFNKINLDNIKNKLLLIIDGGKGQLKAAEDVVKTLHIEIQNKVILLSIAKGENRKEGLETFYLNSRGKQLQISRNSKEMFLLLQIRNEAHRFAISGHRKARSKVRLHSKLEGIHGVGTIKRQHLLKHFGGIQEIQNAGVKDIMRVTGISSTLAKRIYDALHRS